MLAKFHGNILNLSENIAKSFRGATFFDSHCRRVHVVQLNVNDVLRHVNQSRPSHLFCKSMIYKCFTQITYSYVPFLYLLKMGKITI